MKKLLLSLFILGGLNANAQGTIFEDGFEFYDDFAIENVGDWTLTDIDLLPTYGVQSGATPPVPYAFPNTGVAKSWQVFNAITTVPTLAPGSPAGTTGSNWTSRTGDKFMACFAGIPAGAVTANNDLLITPQITLGTNNTVSFWAKPCSTAFGLERFKVSVSTTGVLPANFTKISAGNFITTPANTTWVQYTYTIPATYNNLPVYIAVTCVSNDQFTLGIDDFNVSGTVLATEDFFTSNFSVYPNPANSVLNINSKNNMIVINTIQLTDINGRIVKTVKGMTNQINISELNAGVYLLKITTEQGTGTTKIIKN